MSRITPLEFNTAMKTLSQHTLYERGDAELAEMTKLGTALNQEGLAAAHVLTLLAAQNAELPDISSQDLVAGWLYAALGHAMFGNLAGSKDAVGHIPMTALLAHPMYGMTAALCSPRHFHGIVAADYRLAQFSELWKRAFYPGAPEDQEEALQSAVNLVVKTGLSGGTLVGSFCLHAQIAAWQVYDLAKR